MNWRFATPLLLALLGLSLRIGAAREHWLSPDEGLRYFIARAPLAEAWELVLRNAHPPLFPAVSRVVALLADDGLLWLRATSLICGTLAIAVLYAVGHRLRGAVAGSTAAILLVFSPGAIAMSQVARPYALQLFGLTTALLFAVRLSQTRQRRDLYGYAACITAAMMTHYGSLLVLLVLVAALWLRSRSGELGISRRDLVLAHVPVAAMLGLLLWIHVLPRLWESPLRASAVDGWLAPYFGAAPDALVGQALSAFAYLAGPALGGCLALLYGLACVTCWRTGRRALVGLSSALWAVAVVMAATSLYPLGAIRHVLYLAPFVFLVIGVATAEWVARGPGAVASITAVLGLWLWLGEPLEVRLGLPPRSTPAYAELHVDRSEGRWARGALREISRSPGDLVMDRSTAFTLAPVLGDALATARPLSGAEIDVFDWGQRRVLMIDRWLLEVSLPERDPAAHLASVLAASGPDPRDLWLVTARGRSLVQELAALGEDVIRAVEGGPNIRLIALDSKRYRSALERAGATPPMDRAGPRAARR